MRVTDNLRFESFKNSIAALKEKIDKNQEMQAAGKKVLRPSDDPVVIAQAMQLETQKTMNSQYTRNVSHLQTLGGMYETSLNTVQDALTRAKQLAVSMASDTMNATDRATAAEEVKGIIEQLVTAGNTKLGNVYIFGGKKSSTSPYVLNDSDYSVTFQGSADVSEVYVASGQKEKAGISGQRIFDTGGASDIFAALKSFKEALEANDVGGIRNSLDTVDNAINLTTNNLTHVGIYTGRLDTLSSNLETTNNQLTTVLSDMTDVDVASLYSEYTLLTTAYQASIACMAKLQDLSVLNYLK